MRDLAGTIFERWSTAWPDALASAVAAGIAWALAHELLGHPQPVFAAVAAVVCLAPGLPSSRGRQAVNMMLGLVTGILVGEVLLAVPVFSASLRITLITFLAIMAALTFGLTPVIAIQGGVSALLVITLGPITAGPTRLMDALVGTGVALLFSQILLTPDPVRIIDDAVRRMLRLLAEGFARSAQAVTERDPAMAEAALTHFFASRESLDAVVASINMARSLSRWSLRGRLAAGGVSEIARRYDRRVIHLFASTLLFAEALANALKEGDPPPAWLPARIDMIARVCTVIADGSNASTGGARSPDEWELPPASWQACLDHLRAIEDTLCRLQQFSAGNSRGAAPSKRA
jgi:uncharacterized membrane protein YgaE (UPF0421/DUF939 family)